MSTIDDLKTQRSRLLQEYEEVGRALSQAISKEQAEHLVIGGYYASENDEFSCQPYPYKVYKLLPFDTQEPEVLQTLRIYASPRTINRRVTDKSHEIPHVGLYRGQWRAGAEEFVKEHTLMEEEDVEKHIERVTAGLLYDLKEIQEDKA